MNVRGNAAAAEQAGHAAGHGREPVLAGAEGVGDRVAVLFGHEVGVAGCQEHRAGTDVDGIGLVDLAFRDQVERRDGRGVQLVRARSRGQIVEIAAHIAAGDQVQVALRLHEGARSDVDGVVLGDGCFTVDRARRSQAVGVDRGRHREVGRGAGVEVDVAHRVNGGVRADLGRRVVGIRVNGRGRVGAVDHAAGIEVHGVGAIDVVQGVQLEEARVRGAAGDVDIGVGTDIRRRVVGDGRRALGGVALEHASGPGTDVVLAGRYQVFLGRVRRQDLEALGDDLSEIADVGVDRGAVGVVGPRAAEPDRIGLGRIGLAVELRRCAAH